LLLRYKPLEGSEEHEGTLDALCDWVRSRAEAKAAQAARREEERRRQEEERLKREADPVWQAQQREAARKRKQAEQEAAERQAEQLRLAAEQEAARRRTAAKAKKAAWKAKAKALAAKVQSPGPGQTDAIDAKQGQQELPQAGSEPQQGRAAELAEQLASCQECKKHLRFCHEKECSTLLQGSCKCSNSTVHPGLTK
jgi:acetyl/propionyl-CoA carboxylase alpha subunit